MDPESFEKVLLESARIRKSKGVKPKHKCICGYKTPRKGDMKKHQAICCIHKEQLNNLNT